METSQILCVCESRSVMSDSLRLHGLQNSPGQNTGMGRLSLPQGIFPTQGSNPHLPDCRRILYQLSHPRSPRILEWVAYPFSRVSSWSRNWAGVSCTAGVFFTNWAIREAQTLYKHWHLPSLYFWSWPLLWPSYSCISTTGCMISISSTAKMNSYLLSQTLVLPWPSLILVNSILLAVEAKNLEITLDYSLDSPLKQSNHISLPPHWYHPGLSHQCVLPRLFWTAS